MRVKGIISYDGSHYYGFQIQENKISIQKLLQDAISKIMNKETKIFASGRTDRGVHALNQVIHFDIDEYRDLNKMCYALNKLLPNDIFVKSLQEVDLSFHARYSATKKHYRYLISRKRNPFLANYSLFYFYNFNEELVKKGMNLFLGEHNFINFCSNKEKEEYIRTIYEFNISYNDDEIVFDIIGSGFKRYMVRMIIGTILALNNKQIDLSYIEERLNGKYKTTLYNAPSQGLYLVEVSYD